MTENQPLSKLVNSEESLVKHSNGMRKTESLTERIFFEEHVEAPCCRDIHGRNKPPDGGMRAWIVMISAFICNGVIFGIINTYGVIHVLLMDRLTAQGVKEASSKAALVGSLTIGTTFLFSPVAGVLTDKIGLRLTTLTGGLLSATGLLLSSFFTLNITVLYVSYGLMFGLGAALAYTPTLAILGHYFKRYLGKVSGFVSAGSSVFTVILPPVLDYLLRGYGLETTLKVMSLISCFIILCSFVYKPLHPLPQPPQKKPGRSRVNMLLRSVVNVEIWKRKKYVIWAFCVPMALFGYFVPYVHIMKFVQTKFPGKSENLPVMCIGVTSGIGRLIFGVIADLPRVNRIYLQQSALTCIGIVTLLLPLTSSYIMLIVFTSIMGLFDGCFISLLGPIAYEICGPSGATQAIGFLLGLSAFPLTIGPPIAGMIYDSTGSYTTPFLLAGIPPIMGSMIMFLIRCVHDETESEPNIFIKRNEDLEKGVNISKADGKYNERNMEKPFLRANDASTNGDKTHPEADSLHKSTISESGILKTFQMEEQKFGQILFSWLGPYPFLVVGDPQIAQEILTSPHCVNKSFIYSALDDGTGKGLFSLANPKWNKHRRLLNPAFGHKILLNFIPIFNKEVDKLLKTFEMILNEELDLTNIFQHFTFKIAAQTTMGDTYSADGLKNFDERLLCYYKCVLESMTQMCFSPWLKFKAFNWLWKNYSFYEEAKSEIRNYIRNLIASKTDDELKKADRNIFIYRAIDLVRQGQFDWQNVEDECNVIVFGAFETTSNTIVYILMLLAMFPEYQKKVYEEVMSIFSSKDEFEVSYNDTRQMVYLDMVINETMRVMAPVPLVARQTEDKVQLSNGVVIPPGLQIAIDIFNMHRRTDIWGPEAHIFNPDNFLPSNLDDKHPYAFIPFTKGIRNCIGWKYALLSIKITIAKLIWKFRFTTTFEYQHLHFVEDITIKLKETPLFRIYERKDFDN